MYTRRGIISENMYIVVMVKVWCWVSGKAKIERAGTHVTVVCAGRGTEAALQAANELSGNHGNYTHYYLIIHPKPKVIHTHLYIHTHIRSHNYKLNQHIHTKNYTYIVAHPNIHTENRIHTQTFISANTHVFTPKPIHTRIYIVSHPQTHIQTFTPKTIYTHPYI